MAHVESEREQYEPFVEDDEPWAKYLARMRKVGTSLACDCAGLELRLACHLVGMAAACTAGLSSGTVLLGVAP